MGENENIHEALGDGPSVSAEEVESSLERAKKDAARHQARTKAIGATIVAVAIIAIIGGVAIARHSNNDDQVAATSTSTTMISTTSTVATTTTLPVIPKDWTKYAPMHGNAKAIVTDFLKRTTDASDPTLYFVPSNEVITNGSDGSQFLAITGSWANSADGGLQVEFFWHNDKFVGVDESSDQNSIRSVSALTNKFIVEYVQYGPNDPHCCPSLPSLKITYTFDGTKFVGDATPPGDGGPDKTPINLPAS